MKMRSILLPGRMFKKVAIAIKKQVFCDLWNKLRALLLMMISGAVSLRYERSDQKS